MFKSDISEPSEQGRGGRIKNDMIFIAVLLAVALVAGLALLVFKGEGDTVTVTVDGQVWGEYALDSDLTVEIAVGENLNLLVIEDGKAYVKYASCPDGICSAHRPVWRDGESIICLPNKVVVLVTSKNEESPDIIV
jgi:hypothetical protein